MIHPVRTPGRENAFERSPSTVAFGSRAADHIDDHCTGDRGNRSRAPLQAFQFDDAVAWRALVVDDQVCMIDELLAGGVGRLRLLAMCFGYDGDHGHPTSLCTCRHLDHHGDGWEQMRDAVGSPDGWARGLFRLAARVDGSLDSVSG